MAVSPLPVLTDDHVRCAPVLETTTSRLTPTHFQTVSDGHSHHPIIISLRQRDE